MQYALAGMSDQGIRARHVGWRLAAGAAVLGGLIAGYWALSETGALALLADPAGLRERVRALGAIGPLAVVGLMATAIVVNPIPSAPIALAAGAVYGHTWGTLYVLAGAEAGALAAFGIARFFGVALLPRALAYGQTLPLLGSQNALMVIVFVSRLLPFLSFDVVSYAAGLTPLAAWRFALATLAGVLPASFLLAHLGTELAADEADRVVLTVLAIGLLTAIPIAVHVVRSRLRRRDADVQSK